MDWQLKRREGKDLKTKYRPRRLNEIVPTFAMGRVQKICADQGKGQVFLFEGPTGCGKTTLARIVAMAAVCEAVDIDLGPCLKCEPCTDIIAGCPDVRDINAANFRKIEDARELVESFRFRPAHITKRIFILDEVHQVTKDAQQLLLKAFEEPPGHILIIMCTTEMKGLKKTLVDRALTVKFREMRDDEAQQVVTQILKDEDSKIPEDRYREVIGKAQGSVRALLNNIEAALDGDFESQAWTEEGPADTRDLALALLRRNWGEVRNILKREAVRDGAESLRIGVECFIRGVALGKPTLDEAMDAAWVLGKLAGSTFDEPKIVQFNTLVLKCMRACYRK